MAYPAISCSWEVIVILNPEGEESVNHFSSSSTVMDRSSWMVFPPTFTYRASLRRRLPPQAWHVVRPLYRLNMYLYWIL